MASDITLGKEFKYENLCIVDGKILFLTKKIEGYYLAIGKRISKSSLYNDAINHDNVAYHFNNKLVYSEMSLTDSLSYKIYF